MIPDDIDLPAKIWRNKNTVDGLPISNNKFAQKMDKIDADNENVAFDSDPFPKQSQNNHFSSQQLPQFANSIHINDESFGLSMYILLILTLAVIILFLNCYCKRRNVIRTRLKCFPFNRLGF